MTVTPLPETTQNVRSSVDLDHDRVEIAGLAFEDPAVAELLRAHPPEQWEAVVVRALATGARGLLSMGLTVDIAGIDERVRATLEAVTSEAERCANGLMVAGQQAVTAQLDPNTRSSMMARALDDFAARRDELLTSLDPDRIDSHSARLIKGLTDVLGPGGLLETRFRQLLDPDDGASVLTGLRTAVDSGFRELRDLLMESRGRALEADRGTSKGFDFEDQVEDILRTASRPLGAIVERTSTQGGELGPDVLVGDFVVTLPSAAAIAVEAKNTRTLTLAGPTGILAELDRAADNRGAAVAVCVSAQPAFPAEVGPFGIYGNRILVVDDGDGLMLSAALRLAAQMANAASSTAASIDTAAVRELLDTLRRLARRFSSMKKSLSDIMSSVDSVRSGLDAMRNEMLDVVADIERAVGPDQAT